MKRFILIGALLIFCSGGAFAQVNKNGEQRIQQGVITETTVTTLDSVTVTKQVRMSREQWRAYRDSLRMVRYGDRQQRLALITRYDAKRGFQQQASFGWWWSKANHHNKNYSALRLSYIGGMRFNDYFFAGAGAGLDIGVSNTTKGEWWTIDPPMQTIAIPLFVNLKGYFTKTKVAPYLSFSAGARLSKKKCVSVVNYDIRYGAFKPFFEVAAGVNYRKSADRNYTFQFGYYTHNIDFEYFAGRVTWNSGFSMSVGMTF